MKLAIRDTVCTSECSGVFRALAGDGCDARGPVRAADTTICPARRSRRHLLRNTTDPGV